MRRLLAYSDFLTVPMGLAAIAAVRPPAHLADVSLCALGVLTWTFIEYAVHRALHMRRFPRLRAIHMRHHQHPAEPSGGTLYSSLIILGLIIAAIVWSGPAPVILGLLAGYLFFIALHHAEHHGVPRGPLLGRLAANHAIHHHAGPGRMFGVSTSLWDRLFGTL